MKQCAFYFLLYSHSILHRPATNRVVFFIDFLTGITHTHIGSCIGISRLTRTRIYITLKCLPEECLELCLCKFNEADFEMLFRKRKCPLTSLGL